MFAEEINADLAAFISSANIETKFKNGDKLEVLK